MANDPQQTWTDYYARIRERRVAESRILHNQMSNDGVDDSTVLALDFMHFGESKDDVRQLADQLSENYNMTVMQREDAEYWHAEGTTRPHGIDGMDESRCTAFVEFMCDVAQSYGCLFSTWRLTDPSRNLSWTNETIDIDPETGGG